ncbi:MAG: IS1595 family transposase [Terriglobales bacterium]
MEPKTLHAAMTYFADSANCREYMVARRWPNGVECPRCGGKQVSFLDKYNRWFCRDGHHDGPQFTLKTGTIMEDSPISLDKWLMAVWMVVNCKNGVSSYEIHRDLGITQKSAWLLNHRIRLAMQDGFYTTKLGGAGGEVEVGESFIGGKARNMHLSERKRRITGTGPKDKAADMGILERGTDAKPSTIRTAVVPDRKTSGLRAEVRKHVEAGAALYSDALKSYEGLEGGVPASSR